MDVDAGTDDAWALFMLIKAMDSELCEILAITCVNGNTSLDNVVVNVLRVLKAAGKDTKIPVYRGAVEQLIRVPPPEKELFHGKNGFGDIEFEDQVDLNLVQPKHAVNAIYDLVKMYPKDVELICVGPLTNLAIALRMFGDLEESIKEVFIMGGNHLGVGNITKSAEFNFYTDPEAANICLDSMKCPITILPWETCTERNLVVPIQWRFDELGAIDSSVTRLLNPIDKKCYLNRNRIYYRPADALLTSVFLCPEIVEISSDWHAAVELHGTHSRGQVVLDHQKTNKINVKIVERINTELFKKMLLWTAGHPNHVCISCDDK